MNFEEFLIKLKEKLHTLFKAKEIVITHDLNLLHIYFENWANFNIYLILNEQGWSLLSLTCTNYTSWVGLIVRKNEELLLMNCLGEVMEYSDKLPIEYYTTFDELETYIYEIIKNF